MLWFAERSTNDLAHRCALLIVRLITVYLPVFFLPIFTLRHALF